jgi:hypothetical protein
MPNNILRKALLCLAFFLLLIIAIKPLNNDELFFLHHAWSYANENISRAQFHLGYPFPFFTILLSIFFKLNLFNLILFIKPIFSLLFFYVFARNYKNKTHTLALVVLLLILLNRGIEIRPESLCCIIFLCLFEFKFNGWKKYLKLASLILISFTSPRFIVISVLYFLRATFTDRGIWWKNIIFPFGIFIIAYSFFIEYPWVTISEMLRWNDFRASSNFTYKFTRVMSPAIIYLVITLMILLSLLYKIYKKDNKGNEAFYLLGISANFLFLFSSDKVPFEYSFLPPAIFAYMYIKEGNLLLPKFSQNPAIKKIFIIFIAIIFINDIHKKRDHFKNFFVYYKASENLSISDATLLDTNIFSFDQIKTRIWFCNKYRGFNTYSNRYNFHPICLSDEFYIEKSRGNISEEDVIRKINLHDNVIKINKEGRFLFVY